MVSDSCALASFPLPAVETKSSQSSLPRAVLCRCVITSNVHSGQCSHWTSPPLVLTSSNPTTIRFTILDAVLNALFNKVSPAKGSRVLKSTVRLTAEVKASYQSLQPCAQAIVFEADEAAYVKGA